MINHSPQLLQENKIDKQQLGNIPNSQDKADKADKVDKAVNADFSSKNYTPTIHKPNKIKKRLKKDENLRVTGRKMEELPKTDGAFDFDEILQNLKSASTSIAHTDSRRQSCLLDQGGALVQKSLASPRTNQCK